MNLPSSASSSFLLSWRKITWLNSLQPKTRALVEDYYYLASEHIGVRFLLQRSHRIHFQMFLFCNSNHQSRSSRRIFLVCPCILLSNLCHHFPNQLLECQECRPCKSSCICSCYSEKHDNQCPCTTNMQNLCILQGMHISRKGTLVTLHCCRIQVIYSPITDKNFVTVYTYCFWPLK